MRARIERYAIACDATDAGMILANWFDDPSRLDGQRQLMKEPERPLPVREREIGGRSGAHWQGSGHLDAGVASELRLTRDLGESRPRQKVRH